MSGINMFEFRERLTREELQRRDSVRAVLAELKASEVSPKTNNVPSIVKTAVGFATSDYSGLSDEEFEAGIAAGVDLVAARYMRQTIKDITDRAVTAERARSTAAIRSRMFFC